jgi:hypothetical protein
MNQDRGYLGVVAVDDKIYAIGGSLALLGSLQNNTRNESHYVATNERYDPKTNSWTTLTSMPTPRYNFAIAACEGKIYCIGGYYYNEKEATYNGLGVNEVYDIATDSWSTKTSLPISGGALEAQVIDGKIFVLYGVINTLFVYDPITDLWTTKTSIPSAGEGLVSAVVNDKIIVMGTFYYQTDLGTSSDLKVLIYTPKTDTWSEGTVGPGVLAYRYAAGATSGLYAPQGVYVFCGFMSNDTLVYDPVKDVWSVVNARPTNRVAFGVTVVDDVFYVIGGFNVNNREPFSVNERYVPVDYNGTLPADSRSFLDNMVLAGTLVITATTVAVSLLVFFKKNKRKKSEQTPQSS